MIREERSVRAVVEAYWEAFLALEPLFATQVGDERFDDRLPDPTDEGLAERERIHRGVLEDLAGFARDELDQIERTSLDVIEALARRELDAVAYRFDQLAAADHLIGPGTLLVRLGSLQRADTPERLRRYRRHLESVPRHLAARDEVLWDGAKAGQTSPGLVVDRVIAQVERLLSTDPAESPALGPVPEDEAESRQHLAEIRRDRVYPAYAEYLSALRDYRPSATKTLGLGALPGGEQMYGAKILAWTTLPLPADRVHEIGVEELARIQGGAEGDGRPPGGARRRDSDRPPRGVRPELVLLEELRLLTVEDCIRIPLEAADAHLAQLQAALSPEAPIP